MPSSFGCALVRAPRRSHRAKRIRRRDALPARVRRRCRGRTAPRRAAGTPGLGVPPGRRAPGAAARPRGRRHPGGAHAGRHRRADHRHRPLGPGAGPRRVPRLPHPLRAGGDAALVPRPHLVVAGAAQARRTSSAAVAKATEPLAQELGRAPRPSELAARLGVDVEDVIDALDARANQTAGALDAVDPHTRRPDDRAARRGRREPGEASSTATRCARCSTSCPSASARSSRCASSAR